jgi:hypothetical protein
VEFVELGKLTHITKGITDRVNGGVLDTLSSFTGCLTGSLSGIVDSFLSVTKNLGSALRSIGKLTGSILCSVTSPLEGVLFTISRLNGSSNKIISEFTDSLDGIFIKIIGSVNSLSENLDCATDIVSENIINVSSSLKTVALLAELDDAFGVVGDAVAALVDAITYITEAAVNIGTTSTAEAIAALSIILSTVLCVVETILVIRA